MATNKEKIMIYIEKVDKNKLEYLCKNDNRSMSNYINKLIQKDIMKYELENGEIKIDWVRIYVQHLVYNRFLFPERLLHRKHTQSPTEQARSKGLLVLPAEYSSCANSSRTSDEPCRFPWQVMHSFLCILQSTQIFENKCLTFSIFWV